MVVLPSQVSLTNPITVMTVIKDSITMIIDITHVMDVDAMPVNVSIAPTKHPRYRDNIPVHNVIDLSMETIATSTTYSDNKSVKN